MDRLILNCDLGENEPREQTDRLLALVDAANIGCGHHAGSPEKTNVTIERALAAGVMIGAHPGLVADGGRWGRAPSAASLCELLERQVGTFAESARSLGAVMDYIKLHGTLYHAVETDEALAETYLEFIDRQSPKPAVFALAGGRFARLAEQRGLRVYHEAFADRAYRHDGTLVPRQEAHAVLTVSEALTRFRLWREQGTMPPVSGEDFSLIADTLCVHGDSPGAAALLGQLREALKSQ